MRATGSGVIGMGFVMVPVSFFKASRIESVRDKLHTACECGESAKQIIVCPNPTCGKTYTSWWQLPMRIFDAGAGIRILLTQKEIDEVKMKGKKDTMEVEKVVSLQAFATRYILTDPFYILPPNKAVSATKRIYRLLVVALATDGKAMLTRMTVRGNTKRIAIIADPENGILMGYEVQDAKPLEECDVPKDAVDEKLLKQAKGLLAGLATEDTTFVADPDPVEALLSAKIDAVDKSGLIPPIVSESTTKGEEILLPEKEA